MEDKIDQLIRSLKEAKPVLQNSENLTDSIMEQIKKVQEPKVSPLLIWTRAILSTAAVLLVGLLIFQQTEARDIRSSDVPRHAVEPSITADSTCIQILDSNRSNLMETYLCYMQQNAIENEFSKPYPKPKTIKL